MLFNSRTKQSRDFIKSSNQIGRLVFNQVLHRGVNTTIQYNQGTVEIINAIFQDGLKIKLENPDVPLHLYGAFLKSGILGMNLGENQVYWDYIPDLHAADPLILFNPDMFLFPGVIQNITGISDYLNKQESMVTLYPNPAHEVFHVKCDQAGEFQVRIYDTKGRVVYSGATFANQMSIPTMIIGDPGLYYVRITGAGLDESRILNIL